MPLQHQNDPAHQGTAPDQPQAQRLLRIEEVAEILSVSKSFAYQQVGRGDLPSVRLGRSVRVRYEDLMRFIEANVSGAPVQGEVA